MFDVLIQGFEAAMSDPLALVLMLGGVILGVIFGSIPA